MRRSTNMMCISICILVIARLGCTRAEVAAHKVESLPGWDGDLPSRQFSGLLPIANGTKHLHYWLVESERDPESDPLVLWLQGGPGASSLMGYFTELGPLLTNDDSTLHPDHGVPTLFYNPYSWSQVANLLFIESPAGVGFSYCEEGLPCENNDESTADDTEEFFRKFYDAWPEYKDRDLYITGESYAGVFLPMLAERLIKRQPHVKLKGMAAGNGCWGTKVGICSGNWESMAIATEFFHAHNMFDDALWEDMQTHCDWKNVSEACEKKVNEMRDEMGQFWLYNIYDTCSIDQALPPATQRHKAFDEWFELTPSRTYQLKSHSLAGLDGYKCGAETSLALYLANDAVQKAIHVEQTKGKEGQTYTLTVPDLRPLYTWLSDRIKVLIYSGDVDSCVPTLGTESYFLRTLDLTVSQRWAPWKCENEDGHYARAGYYEKFGGTKHGIDFVTFNGAGHMVPQYKPVEALALMKRWLEGSSMRGNFQPSIKAASAAVADMIANEDPDAQTLWRRPS